MEKDDPEELLMMLLEKLFIRTIAEDLREKTIEATKTDEFAISIKKCLQEKGIPPLRTALSDCTLDDEIILSKGKTYIPPNTDLRREIIKDFHELPASGHPGIFKTLVLLIEHYWWPLMPKMVKQFIDGCTACKKKKKNTHPTAAQFRPKKPNEKRIFSK